MANQGSSIQVVDGGGPPPPPAESRDASRSAARASLAASLADELSGLDAPADQPPPPAEPDKPTDAEPEPEEAPEEPAKPKDEDAEDEQEAKAEEADEEPEKADKPDKDLERRLSAVRAETKRAKAAIAEERRAFAEEKRAVQAEIDEARAKMTRINKAVARFKADPVALALEAGLSEDDFEDMARAYYAASPKGKTDPRLREQVTRSARDRQHDDELAQTRRELAELKQTIQQQTAAQRTEQWLDGVASAADDETPLVRTMLEKSPKKARARLAQVAEQLLAETDEVPDPSDVVAELEKIRREELEELGIDVPAAVKADPKTKPLPAAKTKPAKTLSSDLRTQAVQPRSQPMSRDERRRADFEQLAADMAAGRLDA